MFYFNGYSEFAPGVGLSTPTTVPIIEGIENIFTGVSTPNITAISFEYESPHGVILATNNGAIVELFEALHSVFETTNYGDIRHILSPYPTQIGVEFLGAFDTPFAVFNEMNDSKINENEIYEMKWYLIY